MSGMFSNPRALAPFFDELIAVEGERPTGRVRQSVKASVMPAAKDELLGDASFDTTRRDWSVSFLKCGRGGWNLTAAPQIGDRVRLKSGAVATVAKVTEILEMYELEVREC